MFGCRRRLMHEKFGFKKKVVGAKLTPHSVLGLAENATRDEVKARHRELAMKYHPDRSSRANKAKFQQIQQAYDEITKGEKVTKPIQKPYQEQRSRSSSTKNRSYNHPYQNAYTYHEQESPKTGMLKH